MCVCECVYRYVVLRQLKECNDGGGISGATGQVPLSWCVSAGA